MVLAVSSALTAAAGGDIPVLRQDSNIEADGHYNYQYELGNGVSASESGVGGQSAQGNFAYVSPEGESVSITYTADENGYQAHGSHVPEIPPYILKSLEYIRAHAPLTQIKRATSTSKSFAATPSRVVLEAPRATAFKKGQNSFQFHRF